MFTALTMLALAGPAHADCGAKLVRVADDQPWLTEDVRAVVRTDGAPATVERWLLDLGDAGCGPTGACAPVFEATWQPGRTTGFFAGALEGEVPRRAAPLVIVLTMEDGSTHRVDGRARHRGPANSAGVKVPALSLKVTQPVLQLRAGGARVVVRVVGERADEVTGVAVRTAAGQAAPLTRKQLHHVAEGEARAAMGAEHRRGAAILQGLDAAGAEVCFQEVDAELDLGWQTR